MVINTNIPALQIVTNLFKTNKETDKSMQRLSSGLRINSVADDPAGLAISNSLVSQIKGMTVATRNVLDGVSIMQTADGALGEIQSMVQRLRELGVQASNGSNTDTDRAKVQAEADELVSEINDMVQRTEFNNKRLIDGELGRSTVSRQGVNKADNTAKSLYVSSSIPSGTLLYQIDQVGTPAKVVGSISQASTFPDSHFNINGVEVLISSSDTADVVLTKIKDACLTAGVEVLAPDYPNPSQLILISKNMGDKAEVRLNPIGSAALAALGLTAGVTFGTNPVITNVDYIDEFNRPVNSFMNAQTVVYDGNQVSICGKSNESIILDLKFEVLDNGLYQLADGTPINDDGTLPLGPIADMSLEVKVYGPLILQVGQNQYMEMTIDIPNVSAKSLGLDNLNYKTLEGAQDVISRADEALNIISRIRSGFGAFQNRLEFTFSNLSTSIYNTEVSNGRIMDTDMAAEMTNFAQLNVLSQAGISILAQANQRPQQLLQLLR